MIFIAIFGLLIIFGLTISFYYLIKAGYYYSKYLYLKSQEKTKEYREYKKFAKSVNKNIFGELEKDL